MNDLSSVTRIERFFRSTSHIRRRCWEATINRKPLPAPTPIFDAELQAVARRIGRQQITRMMYDEFEEFYLSDGDKSIEELDRDFLTFEKIEQYDENGIIGIRMSGGQSSVVSFDFEYEVDASYLPSEAHHLGSTIGHLFVGHQIGGNEAILGRKLIFESRTENANSCGVADRPSDVSVHPFSNDEFEEWLALKMEQLYGRMVFRSVRRLIGIGKHSFEYMSEYEVNPDSEEMQYTAAVCRILWYRLYKDFHMRSLRNEAYQTLYTSIRSSRDTADVADLKKKAFTAFKERNEISLKEFTALNTVAKSQEVRLRNRLEPTARKWLRIIRGASSGQIRYRKFALYNDPEAKEFTRQEKQHLWDAVRQRESDLKLEANTIDNRPVQQRLFANTEYVKVVAAA